MSSFLIRLRNSSGFSFRVFSQLITKIRGKPADGFTLVELLVVIAILGTLSGIAIPSYSGYYQKARITKCIAEIRILEKEIKAFEASNDSLPNTLNDIGQGTLMDPWGNPYQYLVVLGTPTGELRKDRFLVPLNSDFDLYSKGRDGNSQPPLTVHASHDDIVRANDGGFVGLALEF